MESEEFVNHRKPANKRVINFFQFSALRYCCLRVRACVCVFSGRPARRWRINRNIYLKEFYCHLSFVLLFANRFGAKPIFVRGRRKQGRGAIKCYVLKDEQYFPVKPREAYFFWSEKILLNYPSSRETR